jgi:hypothetical protein
VLGGQYGILVVREPAIAGEVGKAPCGKMIVDLQDCRWKGSQILTGYDVVLGAGRRDLDTDPHSG